MLKNGNYSSCVFKYKSFPKQQISHSSKLIDFADDSFKFDENGRKFSKWIKNTEGKGEIARYKQFLLFHTVFLAHLSTTCSG